MGDADPKKVDAAVSRIKELHDKWGPSNNYKPYQAQIAADELLKLNPTEMELAWNGLTKGERQGIYNDSNFLFLNKKYADLLNALHDDKVEDAKKAVQSVADKKAEAEPKFGEYGTGLGSDRTGDTVKHFMDGSLPIPKGTKPGSLLEKLVIDTSWTMQNSFDSLGNGKPKDPVFSPVLKDTKVDTLDGWSNVINKQEKYKKKSDERKETYDENNKGVDTTSKDAKGEAKTTLDKLKDTHDKLYKALEYDYGKTTQKGNSIKADWGGKDPKEAKGGAIKDGETIYTRDKPEDNFTLTKAGELYYIHALKQYGDQFTKDFDEAAEKFRGFGSKVDGGDGGKDDPKPKKPAAPANPAQANPAAAAATQAQPVATPTSPSDATDATDTTASDDDWSHVFPADLTDPQAPTADTSDTTSGTDDLGLSDSGTDEDGVVDDTDDGTGSQSTGSEQAAATGTTGQTTPTAATTNPFMNSGLGSMVGNPLGSLMNQSQNNPFQQLGQSFANTGTGQQGIPGVSASPAVPTTASNGTAQQIGATNQMPGVSVDPAVATTQSPGVPAQTAHKFVDMQLPDRSGTQPVTAAVADAVNKELNNPNGCDAVRSYGNNLGNLQPFDDYPNLHTGDIAKWDNRSAIVIDEGSNKYLIVDGTMHELPRLDSQYKLDMNNLPFGDQKDFGNFQGFFRPDAAGDPDGSDQVKTVAAVSAPSTIGTRPADSAARRT
ncbi:hypothetical protein [Nocardia nova]|uniref:hypothetical protein n=1 Tax=Nocardia nova TaxID=37330 RepID=UPI0033CE44B4